MTDAAQAGQALNTAGRFDRQQYLLRRKVFKVFGAAFHILDAADQLVFYSKMKAFKLKEDIRLYTGEDMREEVLTIQARQVIDFSAAYDVIDPASGGKVGALKRKGWKSMIKDEWIVMDASDREIGLVREDNVVLALLRRFITNLIPQTYHIEIGGQRAAVFRQRFNPFIFKLRLEFPPAGQGGPLDRRLGIAAAVLLGAIEGRQN